MAYTTIDNPELYFQCKLWTGNATARSITLDGDENMQPDFVWIKRRNSSRNHALLDSVRGGSKQLKSNSTDAEGTDAQLITSFDSDGFSIGTSNDCNSNTDTYVAWCWKESADAGFDIVSYTGNNTVRTISHNLSAVPKLMIFKERSEAGNWVVYHGANTSAPATDLVLLNLTNATADDDSAWNDTAPTSSVFTLGDGDGGGDNNKNTITMIGYIFAEKQGFSKFGSYTGNGNADGAYVHLGFRPAWLLLKQSSASGENWLVFDNKRLGYNVDNNSFNASADSAEATGDYLDLLSNGFKIRSTNSVINGSGSTYIYMAFAEAPFVNSNGVPANAR